MIQYHPEPTQPIIFKERFFTKSEKSHDGLQSFSQRKKQVLAPVLHIRWHRYCPMLKISQINFLILSTVTSVQEFHVDLQRSGRFLLMVLCTFSFVFFTESSTKSSVNISPKKNIGSASPGTFIFIAGLSLKGKVFNLDVSSIHYK